MLDNRTFKKSQNSANEPIPVIGRMQTAVQGNIWRKEDAEFVVVRDGLNLLIGRNLFNALGGSVTQTLNLIEGNMIMSIQN